ncbi:hypothetical protein DKX38_001034 [Salix brachista]|uniref:START domain-containing protein n=1 Tax=Salix brachista TaxID=2182728 RepID=A0A5N5P225_9ROSI|nr:hypothetical protein DKX38_001034 [Salix brachista]
MLPAPAFVPPSLDLDMSIYSRPFPESLGTCTDHTVPMPMFPEPSSFPEAGMVLMEEGKGFAMGLALSSMDELAKMCHAMEPLWIKNNENGKEVLNLEEHARMFPWPSNRKQNSSAVMKTEATRDCAVVIMNSINLVDAFLDANKWMELFPSIVARAKTVQVITTGVCGASGSLHLVCMDLMLQFLIPSPEARVNMMRLAQRMIRTFCLNISTSSGQSWTALPDSYDDTVRITTRKTSEPGQPHRVIISAVSTTWLPYPHFQVFDLLRDEHRRSQLEILSNGNALHEVAHVANGSHPGNCISLLRINVASNSSQHVDLMLQESCTDQSGSLVVFTTVDVESIQLAMSGEDPSCIPLLPLGFVIVPVESSSSTVSDANSTQSNSEYGNGHNNSGCLLTVGLQVLANTIPSEKLNFSSVTAINNHLCNTVNQITAALSNSTTTNTTTSSCLENGNARAKGSFPANLFLSGLFCFCRGETSGLSLCIIVLKMGPHQSARVVVRVIPSGLVPRSPNKLPFLHSMSLTMSLTIGTPPYLTKPSLVLHPPELAGPRTSLYQLHVTPITFVTPPFLMLTLLPPMEILRPMFSLNPSPAVFVP